MVSNVHNSKVILKTDLYKAIKINIPGVDKAIIPYTNLQSEGESQSVNNDIISDFQEALLGLIYIDGYSMVKCLELIIKLDGFEISTNVDKERRDVSDNLTGKGKQNKNISKGQIIKDKMTDVCEIGSDQENQCDKGNEN